MSAARFIAIDIGNTRTKFGLFENVSTEQLPLPKATLELPTEKYAKPEVGKWLLEQNVIDVPWYIASVHRHATETMTQWLRNVWPQASVEVFDRQHFPLQLAVENPEKLGLDRIAGAVAVNRLRSPQRGAIIADLGSALTVDMLTADGVFQGGAILPGIGLSARALHEFTDQLPLIPMSELSEPVPVLGTSTIPAMRSGLYWGAVGAMRELIARLSQEYAPEAEVFLTGGAAPAVAKLLGTSARYEPHLVLSGIAVAVASSTG